MIISLITRTLSAMRLKLRAGMDCIFPDGSAKAQAYIDANAKAPTNAKALTETPVSTQATNPIKAKGSIAPKAQPTNPHSCKPKKTPRKHNKKKRGY